MASAWKSCVVVGLVMLVLCAEARAQFVQQGPKLVGTGAAEGAGQGSSVALSADGATALVGGAGDNGNVGAGWVFTKTGGGWTQQGGKLVGTGGGFAQQGFSVALSADGSTAVVGGPADQNAVGATWVWTLTNGVWTQQGSKLVGTGGIGAGFTDGAGQGRSVAISADGNTVLVGGPYDNSAVGAAWVWIRSGGVWTQQGGKLVAFDVAGQAAQGWSVALSADGNTALIGGFGDNQVGAAWVWTRSGGVWTQQGPKLVGNDSVENPAQALSSAQGWSVALSADGNTALVGGNGDNGAAGAAWVWTRSGGAWTQQGAKLVGTGRAGNSSQGSSVALSADGNVALVGGRGDDFAPVGSAGAAWLWKRTGGVWTQQGAKLVGAEAVGGAQQGASVSLSGDGRTALVGGPGDSSNVGAAWVFGKTARGDFDGDLNSDVPWRHTSGAVATWLMSGSQVAGGAFAAIDPSWQLVGTGDYNADGRSDLFWRHTSGSIGIWFMNGTAILGFGGGGPLEAAAQVVGLGDYNGDGRADLLWRRSTGELNVWLMNGASAIGGGVVAAVDPAWHVVGSGDYNGDARADILWRHTSGATAMWLMDGVNAIGSGGLGVTDPAWQIVGSGDYNADGFADILWRHSSGAVTIWLMNSAQVIGWDGLGVTDPAWQIVGSGDYDGNGTADILWRDTAGAVAIWFMNGTHVASAAGLGVVNPAWQVVSTP